MVEILEDDFEPPYSLDDLFGSPNKPVADNKVGQLLGDAMLLQIPEDLRAQLRASRHVVVVLTVQDKTWVDATTASAERHLGRSLTVLTGHPKQLSGASATAITLASGRALLMVCAPGDIVPSFVSRIAVEVRAEAIDASRIADILRLLYDEPVPDAVLSMDFGHLTYDDLSVCMPFGAGMDLAVDRLLKSSAKNSTPARSVPPLNSASYGLAGAWGMRVAADMKDFKAGRIDWSDCDRGALIVGPPGTGKSQFAASLAAACEVELIVTSVAEWFASSDGYLDGVVKAQRRVFDLARRKSPAIVLFDEVDALPSRWAVCSDHKQYWATVITDFLVNLDSVSADRSGIVVIGATNMDSSSLDPALLRPGRLERVLEIGMPGKAALEDLFRYHLRGALDGKDISRVLDLAQLHEVNAAKVVEWTRAARRLARAGERDMTVSDLVDHLPGDKRTAQEKHRTAVHEVGHAAAGVMLGADVNWVSMDMTGEASGITMLTPRLSALPNLREIEDMVTILLSGRAAEVVLLGDASAAALYDLAHAKKLLVKAFAEQGLGPDLVMTGDQVQEAVAVAIARLSTRAMDLVRDRIDAVRVLVCELEKHRTISGRLLSERLDFKTAGDLDKS